MNIMAKTIDKKIKKINKEGDKRVVEKVKENVNVVEEKGGYA
jgi:hypothetical protein